MISYFQLRIPEPALHDYIRYFWVSEGSVENIDSHISCIFPDGSCHLLYIFKGAVLELETGITFNEGDIIVMGPKESISRYKNDVELGVFGICLFPYVIPLFTSFSGTSLINVTLEASPFGFIVELEKLLRNSKNNNERAETSSAHFKKAIYSLKILDNDILSTVRSMYAGPQLNIVDMAKGSSYSSRHFLRKFKDYSGFTPKKLQRIIRLKAAVFNIKPDNLTHLALDFGYFDQAHFVNDFKKVSGGLSPKNYFKRQKELEWRTVIKFVDSFDT